MTNLKIGVFDTSLKENEHRIPIHPDHIEDIDASIRQNLYFEKGYAHKFDYKIEEAKGIGGVLSSEELYQQCDMVILAKPLLADFKKMREGTTLCGWAHLVQQADVTQVCLDKKLSVITWEGMHQWNSAGEYQSHVFYKNNEIAGYAGVLDAFRLLGIDGYYGPRRKASILGFGSVAKGALRSLMSLGVKDISVFTDFIPEQIADEFKGVNLAKISQNDKGQQIVEEQNGKSHLLVDDLLDSDIIVNAILQDTDAPVTFLDEGQMEKLRDQTLILDISCDEGMGFYGAKPTTFENPMFTIKKARYYAVDHTPSYLWNSASWEISHAFLPYLNDLSKGPQAWKSNETLAKALEIEWGEIRNEKIISFQHR